MSPTRMTTALTGLLLAASGLALLHAGDGLIYRPRSRITVLTEPIEVTHLIAPHPGEGDELGRSVAIDGGVAVVGAPGNVTNPQFHATGSAHVFVGSGWAWRHRQRLVAFDSDPGDSFGRSVSISGDTIVVGAEHDVIGGISAAGSVYVYVRDGSRWSLEQKLVAPDPQVEDHFGHCVAIDGDTLAVGTWDANVMYVFERTGAWWHEAQKIGAPSGHSGSFGRSLALQGDTLAVGEERRYHPGLPDSGGVSMFSRADGSWSLDQDLVAADADANDHLGSAVAIDGDVLIVGAPQEDGDPGDDRGAAYVFVRLDGSWVEAQKLLPSITHPRQQFGESVGVSGASLLVGAPQDTSGDLVRAGTVHLFRRSVDDWQLWSVLSPTDPAPGAVFGEVAFTAHTAIFGARLADVGPLNDAGKAYIFLIP